MANLEGVYGSVLLIHLCDSIPLKHHSTHIPINAHVTIQIMQIHDIKMKIAGRNRHTFNVRPLLYCSETSVFKEVWHLRDTKSTVPMFAFGCVSRPLVWLLRFNGVAQSFILNKRTADIVSLGNLKPFKTRATTSSPQTLRAFKGRIMTSEMVSGECAEALLTVGSPTEWRTGPMSLNLSSGQRNHQNKHIHPTSALTPSSLFIAR